MKRAGVLLMAILFSAGILTGCAGKASPSNGEGLPSFDSPVAQNAYEFFLEISKIPRGTHNEKEISDYLVSFATERNLTVVQDGNLNVFITKPGSEGRENEPAIALQAHMDMVCEKNSDVTHDFTKDPIIPIVDGDWVYANGTTLGADDGSGLSIIMAILDSDGLSHPPLEVVITTDEEDGMSGADSFDITQLKSTRFINVDMEEEKVFTVSCAGSVYSNVLIPVTYTDAPSGFSAYTLSIKGLLGGHSGLDINKGYANANILMSKLLQTLGDTVQLGSINGGSKRNAIPRECTAVILLDDKDYDAAVSVVADGEASYKSEYPEDKDLTITLEKTDAQTQVMNTDSYAAVLNAMNGLPNGVLAMSTDVEGLVQTSSNIGVITTEDSTVTIENFSRSSVESELQETVDSIKTLAEQLGAGLESEMTNAPWQYQENSPLRDKMAEVFRDFYGEEPSIEAIHAGLECGVFAAKMSDGDFISIGPDIVGAHSPSEKMSLSSYDRTCQYLVKILEKL